MADAQQQALRRKILEEFEESEERYHGFLKDLVEVYKVNLERLGLLSTLQSAQVFSNIEEIYRLHSKEFRPDYASPDVSAMASALARYVPLLKSYKVYVNNFDQSRVILSALQRNTVSFFKMEVGILRAIALS